MLFKIDTELIKKHMAISPLTKEKFTASCLLLGINISDVLNNNNLQSLDTIIKVSRLIKINMYYLIK